MNQIPLIDVDDIRDALRADVRACGGIKKVAHELWRTMSASSAEAKLRACLNPDQQHKLDLDEILTILELARSADSHETMQFLGTRLSYEVKPVDARDASKTLIRNFTLKMDELLRQLPMVESLAARLPKGDE